MESKIDEEFLENWFSDYFFITVGVKREAVTRDADFSKDLGLCSFDLMAMLCQIEDRFGNELDCHDLVLSDEIDEVETVQQAIDMLLKKNEN
jgi:acyl carrier protein